VPHFCLWFIIIYYLYSVQRIWNEGKIYDFLCSCRKLRGTASFATWCHEVRETKQNDSDFAFISFLYRHYLIKKNHVRIYEYCGELIIELRSSESLAPIDRINGIRNFRVTENSTYWLTIISMRSGGTLNSMMCVRQFDYSITYKYDSWPKCNYILITRNRRNLNFF